MRIVWDQYIRDQLHWAERLSALADTADLQGGAVFKAYAIRAFVNAMTAISERCK